MHFENVSTKLSKTKTYEKLSMYLNSKYKKGQKGRTREILIQGDIEKAIDNARFIDTQYSIKGKTILDSINEMNPYSNVYTLVEQL